MSYKTGQLVTDLNQCSSIPGKSKILVPCYHVCIGPVTEPIGYPDGRACEQCCHGLVGRNEYIMRMVYVDYRFDARKPDLLTAL
jgi:hypothetical protein